MNKTNENEFSNLYLGTKNDFPNLITLDDTEIKAIEQIAKKDQIKAITNRYILVIAFSSLFFLLLPFGLENITNILDDFSYILEKKSKELSDDLIKLLTYSFLGVIISVFGYIFLLPVKNIPGKIQLKRMQVFENVNRKQINFIIYSITAIYISIGLGIYTYLINFPQSSQTFVLIFRYYLFIPLSTTVYFIVFLILLFLVLIILYKNIVTRYHYSANDRIEITFLILKLLGKLKNVTSLYAISSAFIHELKNDLHGASKLIRNYPYKLVQSVPSQNLIDEFEKFANELERISFEIGTGAKNHSNKIKDDLVNYVNIVLVGDLLSLPKCEMILESKLQGKKIKLYHYIFLAVYLTLPILIVIGLNVFFNVSFNEYNQSLLRVLYIIWAFVGLFTNPILLNSENKELMKDLIKSFVGK